MLIVEGSDLLGKTTLCQQLAKALATSGHIYRHFSRLPDQFNRYWDYLEHASPKVVQDRFHMSEIAYCYGRGERPDSGGLCTHRYRMIDGHLRNLGAFTVVLYTDRDDLARRFKERGDDMYDSKVIIAANEAFTSLARGTFNGYTVDVDMRFCLSEKRPYVTQDEITDILSNYRRRFHHWAQIMEGRPAHAVR